MIKVIDTSKLPDDGLFEALMEIELMQQLDCGAIVRYYDSFIENDDLNLVLEYCAHSDLCQHIKKQNGKSFNENFIWKVFIQMALGLQYLHSRNIVHRDIKSLNIFLTKDNSARVGDLGASRRLCPVTNDVLDELNPQDKVGTPFYLAPELWNDEQCSKATDVWAIGCILYEMCALQVPFLADDIEVLEQRVLKEKMAPLPHTTSKGLAHIVSKCLNKKKEMRPSIEEIIMMDEFQDKCRLLRVALPAELNRTTL